MGKKDEAFWNILSSAIELDFKKGHLKWTLSDLSRKSKVTRSLIYYYFGRSKVNILYEAVKLVGEELIGVNADRIQLWQKGHLLESVMAARGLNDKAPYICSFMLEHIYRPTEVGEALRKVDGEYRRKLKRFYPHLEKHEVNALFSVFWGATFAPGLKEKDIAVVVEYIEGKLEISP